jgi:hypothetical protein
MPSNVNRETMQERNGGWPNDSSRPADRVRVAMRVATLAMSQYDPSRDLLPGRPLGRFRKILDDALFPMYQRLKKFLERAFKFLDL